MNYEQIEAYLAAKCAEVSHAAHGEYVCLKIEAECHNGKVRVQPMVYTESLGHFGSSLAAVNRPENLDQCVDWVKTHGKNQVAKERRDLAASLIAEAEKLEAQP